MGYGKVAPAPFNFVCAAEGSTTASNANKGRILFKMFLLK
jgi:hypothetical protein